ncbi:gp53-like domain-containing protein [Wielerella bovis]|uniref:gp53-like domain-containing protein n=1 Tax=Wielerella bovis TaxID=2917790 RepID=UPI002018737E|nr:hypothetical protein [Wielerella bovis]ULJ60776.1 hypothetical protein MIS44_02630 [Wielerella bovis]
MKGIVKLNNTLTSTATGEALTAAMGKKLNDEKVAKSGDTMTGLLSINTGNSWARMQFGTNDGSWKMEFDPKGAASRQMNFNFNDSTGERTFILFPALEKGVNQLVAYQSWVNEQNPKNRSGIDLDTATTPQFFINAKSGYVSAVDVEHAGLILGYQNDCSQIIAAGGNLWVRGSDANPISKPEDWSEWKRILDEKNGVLKSDFAHSRASNGYQKLPSGLILQWGRVSIKNDSYIATTFPIAFPNTCFNVQTTIDIPRAMRGGDVVSAHVGDISRTGCSIGFSENSYGGERPLYWFAIGY